MKNNKMNKKGISEVMGYILLVSFAIFMSFIVYQGLKTYVPAKALECPEGVSLFVKEASCVYNPIEENYDLTLVVKNNGRYNLAGYFIHASINPNQTVATFPLIGYLEETSNAGKYNDAVIFEFQTALKSNTLGNFFNISTDKPTKYNNIGQKMYSLDLIPVRLQKEENKWRLVSCGKATLREKINCA